MTKIDKQNTELIKNMKEKGEIAYGLENGNLPITLNDLIEFCKKTDIDFNAPILLQCDEGYLPLAHYHRAMACSDDGNEYTLGCLAITDGNY